MSVLIILRGVSGSGKSTFGKYLGNYLMWEHERIICSADDYFINNDGEYIFDPSKLPIAHETCRKKAERAMIDHVDHVIIDNTNTSESEIKPYIEMAKEHGYQVFSLVVENRHGNSDKHNVPSEVKEKQENRIRTSLKLV